ncbi:thioredoxin domain-containing protein [bacterium SCSIO 12741]|nr:thioredoxin domain-containing protein [bacterium SCSIO 12741]
MEDSESNHLHTNRLINETSPYLLQHAHNPVDWYPWGEEALNKAQQENKLLLVSIGYSACHWCHVMERESFEDTAVARYMNEHFVCIKIDREERPDIDQVYMSAVQLMTGSGGWPLNCFALPDGRPVFGGTYFNPTQWMQTMGQIHKAYTEDREKVMEYADRLTQGVKHSDLLDINPMPVDFQKDTVIAMTSKWKHRFDPKEGGPNRAPKFPIPNNYSYLLQYGTLFLDKEVLDHVELTLDKMAYGGIYDQIGGGFARYSTDVDWKVPHFEKMLYDNGQLLSLYSEGYQRFKKPLYKDIAYQTAEYIDREMTAKNGAFYSALDADSEGEEGKFYIWTELELKEVLGEDFELAKEFYQVGKKGRWEHGTNILVRDEKSERAILRKWEISEDELKTRIEAINSKLMERRDTRIRPGLDDKTLTSWNALTISGLVDAHLAFGDEATFLKPALKNAEFIWNTQRKSDGGLNHSFKEGRSTINGYLEDYCFTIQAYIKLYEATFDEKWLERSKDLADYAIEHFYDSQRGMFYFTSDLDPDLIARKMENSDNVIPASNSSMARNLFLLGHYFDNKAYSNMAETMLNNVAPHMTGYGSGYSNWGILYLQQTFPFYEIAISGSDAREKSLELNQKYIPNKMFIGSKKDSHLPLLENKYVEGETYIYVCVNKACQLPVTEAGEALKQINF